MRPLLFALALLSTGFASASSTIVFQRARFAPALGPEALGRGPKTAKHLLVEYTDFQCPYCRTAAKNDARLAEKYGPDLRIVVKMMPLTKIHPFALPAARYFEAAALQSEEKAWAFHDALFAANENLSDGLLRRTAEAAGLDLERLDKDAVGSEVARRLAADADEFKRLGFSGTPSFVADGLAVVGAYPPENFIHIFERPDSQRDGFTDAYELPAAPAAAPPAAAAPAKPWWE